MGRLALLSFLTFIFLLGNGWDASAQSPYYDVTVIAKSGDLTQAGATIRSIRRQVSVNDAGKVAFVATLEGVPGSHILVGGAGQRPRNISRSTDDREFAFAQINDNDKIIARDFFSAGATSLKLWDERSPSEFSLLASSAEFESILAPSLANDDSVGFTGRRRPEPGDIGNVLPSELFSNTFGAVDTNDRVTTLPDTTSRPMTASGGSYVLRSGGEETGAIVRYKKKENQLSWDTLEVASTRAGWRSVGAAPGISDSGKVIAFAGEHSEAGQGVYVLIDDPKHPELFTLYTVAGGRNANLGPGISFDDFDLYLGHRIGVIHIEAGLPGLVGDRILITFAGEPANHASERSAASALHDNPAIPGKQPLLFDFEPALWTVEITPSFNLNDRGRTGSLKVVNRTSAVQVIEFGDRLGDRTLIDFVMHDPLAPARRNANGSNRSAINPSDHFVAFWARTHIGDGIVCLASYLDPDDDGLPNHWERLGGGIDIDRDGGIDLDLHQYGADPMRKDMFVEIDWVLDDDPGGDGTDLRSFAPQKEALDFVVSMFANAPVPNPNGTTGVTVHIDAGLNLSRNMTANAELLFGGDWIMGPNGEHVHEIYHLPDSGSPAGTRDLQHKRPWFTLPLSQVKKQYFGYASKNARELAFRYVVFGDRIEKPGKNGRTTLGIGEARGVEPYRFVNSDPRFIPGNDVLMGLKGRTGALSGMLNVRSPDPGAPSRVPEPPGFYQGQILAHELGHVINLLHGGYDHATDHADKTPRPNHRSLMNYGYSLYPDRKGNLVRDFSRTDGTGTIHDWNRIQLGFARYVDCLGDSFSSFDRAGVSRAFGGSNHLNSAWTQENFEEVHGPLKINRTPDAPQLGRDRTRPEARLLKPGLGGSVRQLDALTVEVNATDDRNVQSVLVAFDIDGDGNASGEGEVVAAIAAGGNVFRATFAGVVGPVGMRAVDATVLDGRFNRVEVSRPVTVIPENTAPNVVIQSPSNGTDVFLSSVLEVNVMATDNFALDTVEVSFDLNGDGDTSDVGEMTNAYPAAEVDIFSAQFQNLAGGAGSRTLRAVARDAGGNERAAQVSVNVLPGGTAGQQLVSKQGTIPSQRTWIFGGSRQSEPFESITVPGRGTVQFRVTSTPPIRNAIRNIQRADSTVRDVVFNGESKRLTVTCNEFGADPAICESSLVVEDGGTLEGDVLGPGVWNTFGEFVGHAEQNFRLEIFYEPEDVVPPLIEVISPAVGALVSVGFSVTVDLSAIDSSGIASASATLDRNGDGDTSDAGESAIANDIGGGTFRATFGALSGAPGARTIRASATDRAGNSSAYLSFVKADGLGAGGLQTLFQSGGLIAAEPIGYNGRNGRRQSRPFGPIEVPGAGRVSLTVRSTPNVRREVQNIQRHDSAVWQISYNDQTINLDPECNPHGSNPAICTSVFDTTEAGTLSGAVLGPATFTVFGEFAGHAAQQYYLDVSFESGPEVASVLPAIGSAGGHDTVTVSGGGFKENAVVLFNGVAAKDTVVVNSTQIRCVTPPGIPGKATIIVLNPDPDGQPWNYGTAYGLFGELSDAFTYQQPPAGAPGAERLLTTFSGLFPETKITELQESASVNITIPGAGKLRFEAWAFLPILSPIPGPAEAPGNLLEYNVSTWVGSGRAGTGGSFSAQLDSCTPLNFAYGPVICESSATVSASAAGDGQLFISGPARWSVRWKNLEVCENLGAPEQHWSIGVWFTPSDPGPVPGSSAYDDWKEEKFTPLEQISSISGPSGDPDKDTIPNAAEFVLHGNPKAEDGKRLLRATTAKVGLSTYPAVELTVRNDLTGVTATLQSSSDLRTWTDFYDITADRNFVSPRVISNTKEIGFVRLIVRDIPPLDLAKPGRYYRLLVTVVSGNVGGSVSGTTELTFDIDGFTNFRNINQDYGDGVSSESMGGFGFGGSGGFTPNISVSYGPDGADPAFWTTGYGDLQNILFEDRDGFGQLEVTFTADDGYLVQLQRWDMAAWTSAFNSPPQIDRLAVIDGSGNVLWEEVNVAISETTHTQFDFVDQPFEAQTLILRFESGNLGNLSDDIALDNIVFGQRRK